MTLKKITGKDIKEAVDWLWENKQDGGCVHQVLGTTDDGTKLCFVVGWSNGSDYGDDDKKYGYFDGGYCISAKIGYQHRNNAMQTDYDWDFNMPYDLETGDVWDTSSYVPRDADWESEAADYNKEAQKIWDAYCIPNEDGTAPIDLMESKKKGVKKNTCSMQKKKESLAKKSEADSSVILSKLENLRDATDADKVKSVLSKLGFDIIEYGWLDSSQGPRGGEYSVWKNPNGMYVDLDYTLVKPNPSKDSWVEGVVITYEYYTDKADYEDHHGYSPSESKKCEGLMDDLPYDAPVAIESLCAEIMSHTEEFTIEDADVAEMCGKWYIRDYANGSTAADNEDEFVDEVLAGLSGSPLDGSPFGAADAEGYARKIYNEVVA